MGLFDTVVLPEGTTLPGLDADPAALEWQTKTIDRPMMRRFRLTNEGRLLQEETRTESVPEEDRPYYGTEKWDDHEFVGSIRTVHEGWTERRYHGTVEFHTSIENEGARYEAKFTDGRLVAVRNLSGDDDGEWIPATEILPSENDERLSAFEAERLANLLGSLSEEVVGIEDDEGVEECVQRIRAYLERREDAG